MQNKRFRLGPVAIPASITNICNPPTATGGVNGGSSAQYIILRHIRIVNKDTVARTFQAYIGATGGSAAGTEFMGKDKSIPANDSIDWYGEVRLDAADFLTMLASVVTTLVVSGEGEIGVSG